MPFPLNNIGDNQRLIMKLQGDSEMVAKRKAFAENLPDGVNFADEIKKAIGELAELDNSGKLRDDAIRNGKAIIKNWKPPTQEQIDKIIFKMKEELLA